jgi:tetratricopeptide (TPR) repeat protein
MFMDLGEHLAAAEEWEEAGSAYEHALEVANAKDQALARVLVWQRLAELARARGQLDEAEQMHATALCLARQWQRDSLLVAWMAGGLADAKRERGDLEAAARLYRQASTLCSAKAPGCLEHAGLLDGLAEVAVRLGDPETAAECRRHSAAIRDRLARD